MKEFFLSLFSSKIPVTKEEYAEIVRIQKYKSFMHLYGKYDDREDRELRKDWEN